MKVLIYLQILFLSLSLSGCDNINKASKLIMRELTQKKEFAAVSDRIKTIKIGMSKEEVRQIMGKPKSIRSYDNQEIWYFKHSAFAAEPPRCIFDKENEKVIEVICGDNYRITAKNKQLLTP